MRNLTLKQLRYFEALARDGRFRRAAETCNISQPALSMQIKELETELGGALFERGARDVKLTVFGQLVAGRVQEILRSVDELRDIARAAQDGFLERLRIGVIPTVAPYLLPAIINDLSLTFEGLRIDVRETQTSRLVQELTQGSLDLAIVALPVSEPQLLEMKLFEEEFVLVRRREEATAPVPDPGMLTQMRLLLLEEGHCFREQALSFCKPGSARPREIMEGSSLATLVQMVGAGIGLTLIPEMAVPVETRSARVSIARFPAPAPTRTIGMVWRKSTPLGHQLLRVAEVISHTASALQRDRFDDSKDRLADVKF